MAVEFKKLSEVEMIESLSDSASVLVEYGGEVKRVPAEKVGGGSGLPDGAESYNQLVTDGENKAIWEERYGYKKAPVEKEIFNSTVTTTQPDGSSMAFSQDAIFNAVLNDGEQYIVTFDGEKYNCTAYRFFGTVAIGNSSIATGSGGNDEPFFIAIMNGNGSFYNLVTAQAGSYSLSVVHVCSEIVPIPYEYTPYDLVILCTDEIKYCTRLGALSVESGSYNVVRTAFMSGRIPRVALRAVNTMSDGTVKDTWYNAASVSMYGYDNHEVTVSFVFVGTTQVDNFKLSFYDTGIFGGASYNNGTNWS